MRCEIALLQRDPADRGTANARKAQGHDNGLYRSAGPEKADR